MLLCYYVSKTQVDKRKLVLMFLCLKKTCTYV